MGEDKEEEGVKEEEAKEAPIKVYKKRKAKAQPIVKPKEKKATKPSPTKLIAPTRASTRETAQKAKE